MQNRTALHPHDFHCLGLVASTENWSRRSDSNQQPSDYRSLALPLRYSGIYVARVLRTTLTTSPSRETLTQFQHRRAVCFMRPLARTRACAGFDLHESRLVLKLFRSPVGFRENAYLLVGERQLSFNSQFRICLRRVYLFSAATLTTTSPVNQCVYLFRHRAYLLCSFYRSSA